MAAARGMRRSRATTALKRPAARTRAMNIWTMSPPMIQPTTTRTTSPMRTSPTWNAVAVGLRCWVVTSGPHTRRHEEGGPPHLRRGRGRGPAGGRRAHPAGSLPRGPRPPEPIGRSRASGAAWFDEWSDEQSPLVQALDRELDRLGLQMQLLGQAVERNVAVRRPAQLAEDGGRHGIGPDRLRVGGHVADDIARALPSGLRSTLSSTGISRRSTVSSSSSHAVACGRRTCRVAPATGTASTTGSAPGRCRTMAVTDSIASSRASAARSAPNEIHSEPAAPSATAGIGTAPRGAGGSSVSDGAGSAPRGRATGSTLEAALPFVRKGWLAMPVEVPWRGPRDRRIRSRAERRHPCAGRRPRP